MNRIRAVRTPELIQTEPLECGAVALAIVLAFHGRWTPIDELRVACGISRNGSRASNLLRAARRYNLEAQAFKAEPQALRRIPLPAILHWNFAHFVVFEGFTRKGRARINDPGMGRREVSMSELDESMTGVVLALTPEPSFERGGSAPRLWRALRDRLGRARRGIVYVLLLNLLLLLPGILMPAYSRVFIDDVLLWRDASRLVPLLVIMTATLAVYVILHLLQRRFLLKFETQMAVQETGRFFWHLLRLPMEFFTQRFPGDLGSRSGLNDRIAQLISGDLAISALNVVVLVAFAAVMLQYDVFMTALSIVLVASNVLVFRWSSRRRAGANVRLLREEGKLNGIALWGLQTIESLKANSSESDLFSRWAGQQARVIRFRQELETANQPLETIPPLLAAINAALVLGIGGLRVIDGQMSLGGLLAFQMLTIAFTTPVQRIVGLSQRLQIAEGEVALLDDVTRTRTVIPESMDRHEPGAAVSSTKLTGRVQLSGVTFGYSPVDPPALTDVSFTLDGGTYVAVAGPTGSGKSSLSRILCGLYEPWKGHVTFDGLRRSEIPRASLTNSIAVVDQDLCVIEGSLRDNILLCKTGLTEDRMLAALSDACILEEVSSRGGLDARIAEAGSNWSGGQLQRLEIARALAGDPSILLLDEATSALDPETEAEIIGNIRRRGCTCLAVTHRLSAIRDADRILVLDEGRIIQQGTHQELTQSGGLYLSLVSGE